MVKVIEERKGGFIELISNFLTEEKVDYKKIDNKGIKIGRDQKAIEIIEKDCKISTNFYQADEIGIGVGISKHVPNGEFRTVINFGKSNNSKDLTIYTGIDAHEGPLGLRTTVGNASMDITIKDVLNISEHSESFVISCDCNYPFGMKCKASKQI